MGVQIPQNPGYGILDPTRVNIPKAKVNPINSNGIIIPPPMGGLSAFGVFNILANSLINSQVIHHDKLKQDRPKTFDDFTTDNNVQDLVQRSGQQNQPDAIPDGRGGYEPSQNGFWTKRLSAVNGLPVMSAITFVGTSYTALNGQVVNFPDITFEMVLISMKKGRNVEKTEITGRETGSVKEYIGAKDWTIEIRAVITASQNVAQGMALYYQTGKYPEENMEMIDLLLNAPIAIQVICPYMNRRGIKYIVIDGDVDISQIEGEYEAQKLVIPCLSDNPLIIQTASS